MSFSAEHFNERLDLLTHPEFGLVLPTDIPDVYQTPARTDTWSINERNLVIVTGPSGVGKDSILGDMLQKNNQFMQAKTASTRARRPNEAADAMTWMRARKPNETEEQYVENLVAEYDLAESSLHHGDVYGLPRANLDSIPPEQIPLLNTDTDGILSLKRSLENQYALTSIMVCPESAAQLEERLHSTNRHSLGRLIVAQNYLNCAAETADYILVNRENGSAFEGIGRSANKVLRLLGNLGIIK